MAKDKNGKNGRLRIIGLIVTLAVLFAGIVGTWALYGENIEDNKIVLEKHDIRLEKTEDDMAEVKSDIKVIRVEQRYIRDGIEEIKSRLK